VDRIRQKIHPKSGIPAPLDRLVWHSRHDGFYRRLEKHFDRTKPDAVVAFMPPAITALARADGVHKPLKLASMHNAPEQDFENPKRWDPSDFDRKRRLELMHEIDCIGILLPEYADWYSEELRAKTKVIPNFVVPVPTQRIDNAKRSKTILCVGRLADVKRHEVSLVVFSQLQEEFPDWKLEIYGTGPSKDALQKMITDLSLEKRAFLKGHTSAIGNLYLSSAILCHPAEFEGFPLAVTEALASGLPVVGFDDCSGLNRLVQHNSNGLLVEPGEGDFETRCNALRDAMRSLMLDTEERERLGLNGPKSMAQYKPDLVVDMWEDALFPTAGKGII
jgi:glycosyltransferase involved in cell wall biosynthesis